MIGKKCWSPVHSVARLIFPAVTLAFSLSHSVGLRLILIGPPEIPCLLFAVSIGQAKKSTLHLCYFKWRESIYYRFLSRVSFRYSP